MDPWTVVVGSGTSDATLSIEVCIGRLEIENELTQSSEAVPSDLREFVATDLNTYAETAMAAYLAIVRGANSRTGWPGMFDRWKRRDLQTRWRWVSVNRVAWNEARSAIVITGTAAATSD